MASPKNKISIHNFFSEMRNSEFRIRDSEFGIENSYRSKKKELFGPSYQTSEPVLVDENYSNKFLSFGNLIINLSPVRTFIFSDHLENVINLSVFTWSQTETDDVDSIRS